MAVRVIPHTLHQIWLGSGKVPQAWSDAWQAMHPTWEYRLWDEDALRALPMHNADVFAHYAGQGDWPGAADVARVEVLTALGGVYADIDSRCLVSFDGAPFMAFGFFAGLTLPLRYQPGRVGNGVIGGEAGHPVLIDYRRSIASLGRYEPAWDTVGGTLLTAVLSRHRTPDVLILPAGTFYPRGRRGERAIDDATPYTTHFWASSPHPIERYP